MEKIWESFAYQRRDLTNCESEPIQFCGAIQSVGWFLAIEKSTGLIQAASENLKELLSTSHLPLETKLEDLMAFVDGDNFCAQSALKKSQAGTIPVKLRQSGKVLSAHFAEAEDHICVDLEPIINESKISPSQFIENLRSLVFQVDLENTLEPMLHRASDHLRQLTHFDRVMIYRFDSNWDGQVVAESVHSEYESFLGLHYPSTDIPAQARKLYLNSHYRMIVDVEADPVRVLTKAGLERSQVDLSCSSLRAVSPLSYSVFKKHAGSLIFFGSVKSKRHAMGFDFMPSLF